MDNKKIGPEKEPANDEAPKKYLCQCIDCIGEWTGIYKNLNDIEKDIVLYCKSGRAQYTVID